MRHILDKNKKQINMTKYANCVKTGFLMVNRLIQTSLINVRGQDATTQKKYT